MGIAEKEISNSVANSVYDASTEAEQLRDSYFKGEQRNKHEKGDCEYSTIPEREFRPDPDLLKRPLPKRPNQDGVDTKVVIAQSSKTGSLCSRHRLCFTLIFLILAFAAGGTFVYIYLRQTEPTTPTPSTTPLPNSTVLVELVLFEKRATFAMSLSVEKPSEVKILFSNHEGDTELLSTSKVQRGNETIFAIDDFLSTATFNGNSVLALVEIGEVRCKAAGKYKLVVRSEDGSVKETELIVVVKTDGHGCPCTAGRFTGELGKIECTFPLKSIQTVSVNFTKQLSGERQILLPSTSISQGSNTTVALDSIRPPYFNKAMFHYKENTNDILEIEFAPTLCTDGGVYYITLIKDGKEVEYEIYFEVYSNPQRPNIFIEASGGLVEAASYPRGSESGDGGYINCVAPVTGCFDVTLTIMKTVPSSDNPNYFYPVKDENGMIETSTKLRVHGWNRSATLTLYTEQLPISIHLSKYKCQYTYNDKTLESNVVTAYVIPANYCETKKRNCLYHHPFACNKFISCGGIPYEQPCNKPDQAVQHFMKTDDCNGHCDWPETANCTIEN